MKFNEHISILLMPTEMCNLHCVYCYNQGIDKRKSHIMSLETLRKVYDATFKSYSKVSFIWHGGEPMCAGLSFMKKAISMQKDYKGIEIRNSIQTNLTLMNEDWACFLKENNISIGSSFDGLQNETLRGNTDEFLANRNMLLEKGVKFGVITVVSGKNISSLIENYKWFDKLRQNYTLNLYINTKSLSKNSLKLNPEIAVDRIIELYEYWLHDCDCHIHINYFERIIKFVLLGKKTVCSFTSCLGNWLGIKWDGEIFPCNRYFPNEYSYGNINDYQKIDQAFESDGFKKILSEAIERRESCKDCVVFAFCEGGCNNVAYHEGGVARNGGETCVIIKKVFQYIAESVEKLDFSNGGKYNPNVSQYLKQISKDCVQEIGGKY